MCRTERIRGKCRWIISRGHSHDMRRRAYIYSRARTNAEPAGTTEESHNAKANVPNVYNLGSSAFELRFGAWHFAYLKSLHVSARSASTKYGTRFLSRLSSLLAARVNRFIVLFFALFNFALDRSRFRYWRIPVLRHFAIFSTFSLSLSLVWREKTCSRYFSRIYK